MADDIKVPVAGKLPKKTVGIVAVGGLAFVVFMYIRRKGASAAPASSYVAPTDTTDDSSDADTIDPATGATYGSVADEDALAQESGSAEPVDYGTGVINGTTSFTTNSEWAQACEASVPPLVNSPTAQSDVAAAIGRFLSGLSLTPEQAQIVQICESEEGPPPVGQFAIIPSPTGTVSSGTPTAVKVPNVVNDRLENAQNAVQGAGLHIQDAPAYKSGYEAIVTSQSPSAGTSVSNGSSVTVKVKYTK